MGAFMRHLQQGTDTTGVPSEPSTIEKKPASKIVKAKLPREPKKPRKKKKELEVALPVSPPKCTTIGLQIQIHDPTNEPPTATSLETSFESDSAIYPFSQECQEDVIGVGAAMMTMSTPPPPPLPPLQSNPISNSMVEMSPSVAAPSNQHHTSTYYNLDQSRADEYIMYDPDPATYGQPMNMMPNMILHNQLQNIPLPSQPQPPSSPTLTPLQTVPIHLGNTVMPQNHPQYDYQLMNYSNQNNSSAALISHFNVSHTNVNNTSTVCDPVHSNWRPINEIMLNK